MCLAHLPIDQDLHKVDSTHVQFDWLEISFTNSCPLRLWFIYIIVYVLNLLVDEFYWIKMREHPILTEGICILVHFDSHRQPTMEFHIWLNWTLCKVITSEGKKNTCHVHVAFPLSFENNSFCWHLLQFGSNLGDHLPSPEGSLTFS